MADFVCRHCRCCFGCRHKNFEDVLMKNVCSKGVIDVTTMLVAAVLAAAVTLGVAYNIYTNVSEAKIVEQCRTSFLKAHLVKEKTIDLVKAPIDCPLQEFSAKNSGDIVDGLRDCWYKTLGLKNKIGEIKYGPDKSFCLVCAEFSADKDISTREVKDFIKSENSRKDGMPYELFFENPAWSGLNRFFLVFDKKVSKNSKLNADTVGTLPINYPYENFKKNSDYWIISQSYGNTPSLFVINKNNRFNAPCYNTHYQKEDD